MAFLSDLINKRIRFHNSTYGKLIDMAISSDQNPQVTSVLIKKEGKRYAISPQNLIFKDEYIILKTDDEEQKPGDEKNFYLVEDLLDKQVIDVTGKKLVRVNDVVLKANGMLEVSAIDISWAGILRRLGIRFLNLPSVTLPWGLIEAFDYDTGAIKIKLPQSRLNTFHPAEIADILEEAGTRERLGIVSTLSPQQAASAIEESDEETQSAILEQIPNSLLRTIVNKMHVSEIADILNDLNPFTRKEIMNTLETDIAQKVQKLLKYNDDEAGGLMDMNFCQQSEDQTVEQVIEKLKEKKQPPENIILVTSEGKYKGVIQAQNLFAADKSSAIKNYITHTRSVSQHELFSRIIKLFAKYNLRTLPVLDLGKKVLGVITVDTVIGSIQEEQEEEETLFE